MEHNATKGGDECGRYFRERMADAANAAAWLAKRKGDIPAAERKALIHDGLVDCFTAPGDPWGEDGRRRLAQCVWRGMARWSRAHEREVYGPDRDDALARLARNAKPWARLEREEHRMAVRHFLGTLSPRDRQIALLRLEGVVADGRWHPMPLAAIAARLGVSHVRVSQRMARIAVSAEKVFSRFYPFQNRRAGGSAL